MRVEQAFPGARAVDSFPYSQAGTAKQAAALAESGVECFIGYLGVINKERLQFILNAGLGFMPVTRAGEYKDGAADEIAQLTALGIPKGATVWLDLEGIDAWNTPVGELATLIEAWSVKIVGAGYIGGLYVGAPMPFTGKQLYALKNITRYWLGIGQAVAKITPEQAQKLVAISGSSKLDAYPDCGWCVRQEWHGEKNGQMWKDTGVLVDVNGIQKDHKGRLPSWVIE